MLFMKTINNTIYETIILTLSTNSNNIFFDNIFFVRSISEKRWSYGDINFYIAKNYRSGGGLIKNMALYNTI